MLTANSKSTAMEVLGVLEKEEEDDETPGGDFL